MIPRIPPSLIIPSKTAELNSDISEDASEAAEDWGAIEGPGEGVTGYELVRGGILKVATCVGDKY